MLDPMAHVVSTGSKLRWIVDISDHRWDRAYLGDVTVKEFLVDNAHTITNSLCMDEKINCVASKATSDDDGALVDAIFTGPMTEALESWN